MHKVWTIAIFGASALGRQQSRVLARHPGIRVVCFLDNNAMLWGTTVDGIEVVEPDSARGTEVDFILVASIYLREIFLQLSSLGLADKTVINLAELGTACFGDDSALSATERPSPSRLSELAVSDDPAVESLRRQVSGPVPASRSEAAARAFCTICSNNYLSYARTLAMSALRQHPEAQFFICLVDERLDTLTYPDADDDRIHVIEAKDLGIREFASFAFRYTALELNTAVKPSFMRHLFERHGLDALVYLDPDIVVFNPLDVVFDELQRRSIALVPHMTTPVADGCAPSEVDILRSGVFNLGFIGLSRSAEASRFLAWWEERLEFQCVAEPRKGLFVDQRWIDLVPAFFDGYAILKHPGFDVAYWNLHERQIDIVDGRPLVNGQPLVFYHYSGVDPLNIERISKYQNRYALPASGALRSLFELYRVLLIENGYFDVIGTPYAYGRFDNGVKIADVIRKVYRASPALMERFAQPFACQRDGSFIQWLNEPIAPGAPITQLFAGAHQVIEELRAAFPSLQRADAETFVWHMVAEARAHALDPMFYAHVTRAAAAPVTSGVMAA